MITVRSDKNPYGVRVFVTLDGRPPVWFYRVGGGDPAAWNWAIQHGATCSCAEFIALVPDVGADPVPLPMKGGPVAP